MTQKEELIAKCEYCGQRGVVGVVIELRTPVYPGPSVLACIDIIDCDRRETELDEVRRKAFDEGRDRERAG
mgnify:CR=1 FL=1